MKDNKTLSAGLAVLLLLAAVLSACAQPAAPQPGPSSEPVTIRIAMLPILDGLPMYVAQQQGLFKSRNLTVEFIPTASAAERDQVITSGQADGMINEIVATIFYNKDQTQVQIVRFARNASQEFPMYRILASPKSSITTPQELKGVDIGVSQGTVIEYLTVRLLEEEGLSRTDIKTIAVPKIPDRMALLGTGELKAAMLPDPLASLAIQQGAKVVVDDSRHTDLGYSTIAFRKPFIDEHPEAIRGFLAAVEEATKLVNEQPEQWKDLLTEQKLVPAPLMGSFQTPKFPAASIPTQAQWDDVMAWMKSEGLVTKDVSYADSVTGAYLP